MIPLSEQLKHFKEYQAKLEEAIGKDKTKELISNALFMVSAGTNDFVVNYFTIPIRRKSYTIPSFMNFVLQEARQVLQVLSTLLYTRRNRIIKDVLIYEHTILVEII